MFGKILILLLCTFSIACADKNYTDDQEQFAGPLKSEGNCALAFSQNQLCAHFNWETYPTETETGSFILRFWGASDQDANPVLKSPSKTLAVILWMSSMGHGSAPVAIQNLGPGVYRVNRVFFTMRGDWEIRFQLKEGNQVVEQAVHSLIF